MKQHFPPSYSQRLSARTLGHRFNPERRPPTIWNNSLYYSEIQPTTSTGVSHPILVVLPIVALRDRLQYTETLLGGGKMFSCQLTSNGDTETSFVATRVENDAR